MKKWVIYFKEYHPEDDEPCYEQRTIIAAKDRNEAAKKLLAEHGSLQIIKIEETYGYSNY